MSNANAAHGDHSNSRWLHTSPGERFKILTPAGDTDGAYTLLEVIADPQYGVPMHVHDNENEHFIVLEGTMRIANDDRTSEVGPGAAITVNKGVPHAWYNLSEVPLRLLVVFSPGNVEGLFRERSPHARATTLRPSSKGSAVASSARPCLKMYTHSTRPMSSPRSTRSKTWCHH